MFCDLYCPVSVLVAFRVLRSDARAGEPGARLAITLRGAFSVWVHQHLSCVPC